MQAQCLGTWLSAGHGGLRFMLGLDDLKGLFQSKRFWFSETSLAEIQIYFQNAESSYRQSLALSPVVYIII